MTFNADPFVASVLILILMEYSLRRATLREMEVGDVGLNPYSNGI